MRIENSLIVFLIDPNFSRTIASPATSRARVNACFSEGHTFSFLYRSKLDMFEIMASFSRAFRSLAQYCYTRLMPNSPTVRQMVTDLVATPSMSSTLAQFDLSNEGVVNLLANWLDRLGFKVSTKPIPGLPGKKNLIATVGQGIKGLVLSGHTDTVPLDEHFWRSDPFKIKEVDNRWYGLGTSDMKSFFALVIDAMAPLMNQHFKHPLVILATADEESGMSGIRALQDEDLRNSKYAVIGEPTSLTPIHLHKGMMMLRADIHGQSGHSSNPELGSNALNASANLINELVEFGSYLKTEFTDQRFDVFYPTLNLGCIHGGNNPNRICDHVSISMDVRTLPGMDNQDVLKKLRYRVEELNASPDLTSNLELIHNPIAPFENDGSELLGTLQDLTKNTAHSVAFATEAPFLKDLGIETIVLGPGSIDQAHQPNEYIDLNQLEPTVAIIRALVGKYCLN